MFYLRGGLRAVEPQNVVDETVGEAHPVFFGIGHVMRVEVARRAAELGRERNGLELVDLLAEPFHEHVDFLAQHRGRGRLAVGARQHADAAPFGGLFIQNGQHLFKFRQHRPMQGFLEHERLRRIVDVLRREAEMHHLFIAPQAHFVELLFDKVLDGLDVVVRHLFYVLDGLHVIGRKVLIQPPQVGRPLRREIGQQFHAELAQRNKVLHFHAHAVAHKGAFRKIMPQRFGLRRITAVYRRNSRQGLNVVSTHCIYYLCCSVIRGFPCGPWPS